MRILIVLLIFWLPSVLFSQEQIDFSKQELFTEIDSMPYFEGGNEMVLNFLNNNSYLRFVEDRTKSGFVSINFIVASDGKIYDPKVLYSPTKEIGEEVSRVVKLMIWNAGIRKGKEVNVSTNLLLNLE